MMLTRPSMILLAVLGCLVGGTMEVEAKLSWRKIERGIERHRRGKSTSFRQRTPRLGKTPKKAQRWQTGGGVVLDLKGQRVLVVRSRKERKEGTNGWTLPKGKVDKGESRRQAARRETLEETGGLKTKIVGKIARYRSGSALRHYYLMTAQPGQVDRLIERRRELKDKRHGRRFIDDHKETVDAKWVSLPKAKRLLQRGRDQQVLKAAERALRTLEREGR